MAGRGPRPKPDSQRRRRNRPTFEWADVVDVPYRGGPKLPSKQPDGKAWPAWTKRWWATVSTMPHCVLWSKGDWEHAMATAAVAAAFHSGDMRVAAELRHRERQLGMTAEARMTLRIRYIDPADDDGDGEDASVTAIARYRAMLDGDADAR